MKKVIVALTFMLIIGFSGAVQAVTPDVTVGLKTWYAEWVEKDDSGKIKFDSMMMFGPSVNVTFYKFFVGLSYLTSIQDFEADDSGTIYYRYQNKPYMLNSSVEYKSDRSDLDLMFGYRFHPRLNAFIGLKRSDIDISAERNRREYELFPDGDGDWIYYPNDPNHYSEDYKKGSGNLEIGGQVIGISGNYSINSSRIIFSRIDLSRFTLYGTLSYFIGEYDIESIDGDNSDNDISGLAIELGAAYSLASIPASISFGYKNQDYKGDADDSFNGFTLGFNYAF